MRPESSASLPRYYTTPHTPCQVFFGFLQRIFLRFFGIFQKIGIFTKIHCRQYGNFLQLTILTKFRGENRLFWLFTKSLGCGIMCEQRGSSSLRARCHRPFRAECQSYGANTNNRLFAPCLSFFAPITPICRQPPFRAVFLF